VKQHVLAVAWEQSFLFCLLSRSGAFYTVLLFILYLPITLVQITIVLWPKVAHGHPGTHNSLQLFTSCVPASCVATLHYVLRAWIITKPPLSFLHLMRLSVDKTSLDTIFVCCPLRSNTLCPSSLEGKHSTSFSTFFSLKEKHASTLISCHFAVKTPSPTVVTSVYCTRSIDLSAHAFFAT
jgi:hypothetical protein